jgi:RimJ/RimL family protein N-acetyltransferase
MKVTAEGFSVCLRMPELADAESIARNANDREIFSNVAPAGTFPNPYKVSDAMGFVEQSNASFLKGTEFNFAVCVQSTGELVGMCGITNTNYDERQCEIGYWIGRDYQGKGYGKEAVMLLLHVAFKALGMRTACAKVLRANTRSLSLLDSAGFKRKGVPESSAHGTETLEIASVDFNGIDATIVDHEG